MSKTKPPEEINLPLPIEIDGPKKRTRELLDSHSEILHWIGLNNLTRFFYLYLFKKYKQTCRIYTFERIGLSVKYALDEETKKNLSEYSKQFIECYKNGEEIIVIPLTFQATERSISGHDNFLLFKRATNTLERFEPHGSISPHNSIKLIIQYFVDQINLKIQPPIKYIKIEESCDRLGVQVLEQIEQESSILPIGKKKQSKEKGYCAIWSMFFAELSLANPTLNFKQLTQIIKETIQKNENEHYYIDIARGYVHFFHNKMEKYFRFFLPPNVTFLSYVKNIYIMDQAKKDKSKLRDMNMQIIHETNYIHEVLDKIFEIEMSLYETPYLNLEMLLENAHETLEELKMVPTERQSTEIAFAKADKSRLDTIKQWEMTVYVLHIMIEHEEELNTFTPIKKTEPEPDPMVLVMDLKSSKISNIPTPITPPENDPMDTEKTSKSQKRTSYKKKSKSQKISSKKKNKSQQRISSKKRNSLTASKAKSW
jgi:hypothetical protein